MTSKFELGRVVMTRGVADWVEQNPPYRNLYPLLDKHIQGDWGEVDDEDKQTNNEALELGNRVLSAYTLDGEKLWIITEWDRSITTILFPSEY